MLHGAGEAALLVLLEGLDVGTIRSFARLGVPDVAGQKPEEAGNWTVGMLFDAVARDPVGDECFGIRKLTGLARLFLCGGAALVGVSETQGRRELVALAARGRPRAA